VLVFKQWKMMFIGVLLLTTLVAAGPFGKISYLEGSSVYVRNGKEKALRVNTMLKQGDVIKTAVETQLEILFSNGTVLRLAEQSELLLDGTENNPKPQVKKGSLWANVQKMATGEMMVGTGTLTAAVRGTIFNVEAKDSASSVALYEGKVDVGPASFIQGQAPAKPAAAWGPPQEVSGPKEVSLEEWIRINPGQKITVGWGGAYQKEKINPEQDKQNAWIQFNQKRDEEVKRDSEI
jgi:hypothetical protein